MSTTIETLKNSNGAMLALAAVAFLITAVLVFFIIRMLIGGRLRMPGGRTRQARLGIVDAFDLDRQRQLILVRRDNTEHLIMIGGPNDLLIESEIVRSRRVICAATRRPEFTGGSSDVRIPAPFAAPAERLEADVSPANVPSPPMALPPEPLAPNLVTPNPVAPMAMAPVPPAPLPSQPLTLPPLTAPALNTRSDDPFANIGAPGGAGGPANANVPASAPPSAAARASRRPPPTGPVRPAGPRVEPTSGDVGQETRPIVAGPAEPRIDMPVAIEAAPSMPASPPAPLVAPAPTTPRAATPSFLKPLPPRPPIRPLARSNPRPPLGSGTEPVPPGAAPAPPAPALPPIIDPPPVTPKSPAPEPMDLGPEQGEAGQKDALESLEEEMAKLLGRGPGT